MYEAPKACSSQYQRQTTNNQINTNTQISTDTQIRTTPMSVPALKSSVRPTKVRESTMSQVSTNTKLSTPSSKKSRGRGKK